MPVLSDKLFHKPSVRRASINSKALPDVTLRTTDLEREWFRLLRATCDTHLMTHGHSEDQRELRVLDYETESLPKSWLPGRGVLLHTGPGKTATTVIHSALVAARPELRKRGTLYPG